MNNTIQNTAATPQRKIEEIHNELRLSLSLSSKDRNPDWEPSISKLINLAYVDYLNQPDNKLAIKTIALIGLAKKSGIQAAKKIAISFNRWIKEAPPSLSSVGLDKEERVVVSKQMSNITADWVTIYAIDELLNDATGPLQKELINWGLKNALNIPSFFEILANKSQSENYSLPILIAILKWSVKYNLFSQKLSDASPFPAVHKLITIGIQQTKGEKLNLKIQQNLISSLQNVTCEFIDEVTSINPSHLLSPTISTIMDLLASQSKTWPKALDAKLFHITKRSINLLALQMPLLPQISKAGLLPTFQAYKKSLPNFDGQFKLAFGEGLDSFEWVASEDISNNFEYPLEEAMLSLLPSWNAYLEKNITNPEVEQLGYKISLITEIAGIKHQGAIGDIIEYNPLRHQLLAINSATPVNVKVIKSGLVVQNKNGHSRVILKTLVEEI